MKTKDYEEQGLAPPSEIIRSQSESSPRNQSALMGGVYADAEEIVIPKNQGIGTPSLSCQNAAKTYMAVRSTWHMPVSKTKEP